MVINDMKLIKGDNMAGLKKKTDVFASPITKMLLLHSLKTRVGHTCRRIR